MEEKTTVVIDIQVDDAGVADRLAQVNEEMAELKKQNADMRKDVKAGTKSWKDVSTAIADNEAKLKTMKAEQSALSGQVAQATSTNRKYGSSLKEQSALLNDLRNRYQSLDQQQRESAGGKKMLEEIQQLDAKMKGSDGTIGLFQRNVGDYANQIAKISGLFGSAGGAASSFAGKIGLATQGLTAMTAVPIIAVINLLIVVIQKVANAMKGSEEQMMRWRETTAVFEPLINSMKNGLSALAGILIDVVQVALKGVTAAMNGLAKATDWVGGLFGKDWGISEKVEGYNRLAEAQVALTKAENEYVIKKRLWSMEESDREVAISDLRAKVADREKYNAEERMKYLQEVMKVEGDNAKKEWDLAEENLRILRERASQTENDTEANDKLAEAYIAANKAKINYNNTMRELNAQQHELTNQIKGEATQAVKEYTDRMKGLRDALKEVIGEIEMLSLEEQKASAAKTEEKRIGKIDEAVNRLKESFGIVDEEVGKLEGRDWDFGDLSNLKSDKVAEFAKKFAENSSVIEQTASSMGNAFGSLASIYNQMADDESKSEEERAEAAKKAKRWSAMQIAANSGTAIAKGIASAMDTPFPGNLAAIATTLAAVLSAIAQAKALSAEGYEAGGVIGGYNGATLGPDNTVVNARRGEMMLNAQQQRELFEIANGGGSASTAQLIANALRNMPQPVLEYSEFKRFTQNVVSFDESQKLK